MAIKIPNEKILPEEKELFFEEARTIAQLRHEHIARLLDFGVQGETPYLILDYAKNGSLRDHYPAGTKLDLATVISYTKQIANALQYAHNQKIVHRDIKPDNFLMGDDQQKILLSDFGIAIASYSMGHKIQASIGTVRYMAPEQNNGRARAASDQYSLAITIYEWLCGTVPFRGTIAQIEFQHAQTPPPPLHTHISIAPSIEAVILKALAKEPEQRFQNVQVFAQALELEYLEQINILLRQAELSVDMLCQEYVQEMLLNPLVSNPDWWNAGRTKISSLRKQADDPLLKESKLSKKVLASLAGKAIQRITLLAKSEGTQQWLSLLLLIAEATPPSTNPTIWVSLLEELSNDKQVMNILLKNWRIHSWLLRHWGKTSIPASNKYISRWLLTTWAELGQFLELGLPEGWYDQVFTQLLNTTNTAPIPLSAIQNIEQKHHSAIENYLQHTFSSYKYRLTTLKLFAKLIESGYTKKMPLVTILLNVADVPDKEKTSYIELLLTTAKLTKEEAAKFLETCGTKLEQLSSLPIITNFIKQYLLDFSLIDLKRPSAKKLLGYIGENSSYPVAIHAVAKSWSTISMFIDKPSIANNAVTAVANAITNLPEESQQPILHRLSKLLLPYIQSEVDLICVLHAMNTVLTEPNLLTFLNDLTNYVGAEYKLKRSEILLVPYIQIILQVESMFPSIPTSEREDFRIRSLNTLLEYADKRTYKILNTFAQSWSPKISAAWNAYISTYKPNLFKESGNAPLKLKVFIPWGLFVLLFGIIGNFYPSLVISNPWLFLALPIIFYAIIGILLGKHFDKFAVSLWLAYLTIYASSFIFTVFSLSTWKTCLQLSPSLISFCPLISETQILQIFHLSTLIIILMFIVTLVFPMLAISIAASLTRYLRTLTRLGLATFILLATIISLITYNNHINTAFVPNAPMSASIIAHNSYPSYLPCNGTLVLSDLLYDNADGYNWDEDGNYCYFSNNAYIIDISMGYEIPCFAEATGYSNFAFEVQVQIIIGDCGGIIFRANSQTNKYYDFNICEDGSYHLEESMNQNTTTLLAHGNNSAIKEGINVFNTLGGEVKGNTITIFVNKQKVMEIQESDYSSGQIGLLAESYTNFTEVSFNNINIWTF